MGQPQFKETGMGSFYGSMLYEQIVPRDHFLVRLNNLIQWDALIPILLPAYKGLGETGRPPYSPVVIFKMLLVSHLYNISERQTEDWVNFYLPAKEFNGLAVDECAPDHSTLGAFKRRMEESGCWKRFEMASDKILCQAVAAGVKMGTIQLVDSVHTVADVDNDADRKRQEKGGPPRDPQAQLVKKGRRRKTEADGKVTTKEVQYLGYKSHVSLNAQTGIITSLHPTFGSAADNKQFKSLLDHDEVLQVGAEIYAADRAYDDTELHYALQCAGKHSALHLNSYRTQKKDPNKAPWLRMLASEEYLQGRAERYKIERKFGEAKRWHGFGRCRSLGLWRYGIQAFMTAIALNVKRIVYLLEGIRFRPPARKSQVAPVA
jgi:transposase, IS5 family